MLGDVAVPAVNLLGQHCIGKALIGQDAFDHRREQAEVILGGLLFLGLGGAVRNVAF